MLTVHAVYGGQLQTCLMQRLIWTDQFTFPEAIATTKYTYKSIPNLDLL